MSPTSANLASTTAAASSGTPRRRNASASWARVRGAVMSNRRQIDRATDSGSLSSREVCSGSSPAPSVPDSPILRPGTSRSADRDEPEPPALARAVSARARRRALTPPPRELRASDLPDTALARHHTERRPTNRRRLRRHIVVQPRSDSQLLLDLLLDLVRQVWVLAQVVPRVLLALTELVALVGVPGARLADDGLLDAQVDEASFPAYTYSIQNVEFGDLERRAAVVADDVLSHEIMQLLNLDIEGAPRLGRHDC